MKAQLASTEEGVFRDVIDRTIEGLCDKVNAWQTESAEKVYEYFRDIEETFQTSYLDEDKEESEAKLSIKHNLRKVVGAARGSLDAMAREIAKCEGGR
jgi:hypothetical protein